MFRNPVLVKGYPIPNRAEWHTGLEIPLNVMAGLARGDQLDRFNERVYIKGFSTLLIPTRQRGDILSWHMIYNRDGSRISFLDDSMDQEQHIGHLDFSSLRHVLGWCSEARFYAGKIEIIRLRYLSGELIDDTRLFPGSIFCYFLKASPTRQWMCLD